MPRQATSNKLFMGVVAALTLCSLAIMLRLLGNFESSMARRIEELQRVFSDPALLKPDQPVFSFAEIEAAVSRYEGQGEFAEMALARRSGADERIVYPFYLPALGLTEPKLPPDSAAAKYIQLTAGGTGVQTLPLLNGSDRIGTLYVRVHRGSLTAVRLAVASLVALLLSSLALFLMQFRQQEITITRTMVELDEKRSELVRLERLALAGQISANIFHDLKKPVLNIKNESEELQPGTADPGIVSRIRQQVDLFFGILRDTSLERFVRARDEVEYVDVNEILERSVALVKYERGDVAVTLQPAPDLPLFFGEPVRLIQVFSNLILNAYQAMKGKGTLLLESRRVDDRDILVQVTDNGPGIPADALPQVFEPFYTTKPIGQGTGLGLYIVRDIIQQAGGSVRVTSQPGLTKFEIRLPGKSENETETNE
jgi:signal transduction histidine kinase